MSDAAYVIRRATMDDAAIITLHRRNMFEDMGTATGAQLDAMTAAFQTWLARKLVRDEYRGWLVTQDDDSVIAGAGMLLLDWSPSPMDQSAWRGYVMNVYVRPDFRRRGLARKLMATILDHCRAQNIRVVALHASAQGRALYESLGFKQTNEMRLTV